MTVTVELPPGDPGTPPQRHSGPVFGYLLEGEIVFEREGEPMLTLVDDAELALRRSPRLPARFLHRERSSSGCHHSG